MTTTEQIIERLLARSQPSGACVLWTGSVNHAGYGRMSISNRTTSVHRVAYEVWVGPIPEGHDIDHLCSVRNCVNPDHLEAVTHAENVRRAGSPMSRCTHCAQGHPFSGDNLLIQGRRRRCATCRRKASRAYRAAKRSEVAA